ncbi:cullin family protein [Rhodotorula paludigena]|uniref:cullin family protein n=1 Tax=Rhodotorula paludigena TaxID=86838 RepID=UPI003178E9F0
MASPPRKMSKLLHDDSCGMEPTNGRIPRCDPALAPAPSTSKRLGLASGVDKSKVKKLTLKPKTRPSTTPDPTQLTNQAVQTLTRAVRAIQSRPPQPTPESLQSLYTLCEAAVASGPQTCQLLYDRIKMEIERQAGEIRRVLTAAEASEGAEERWMGLCEEEGKRFLQQMLLVRSIFLQLDRTWVLQTPGVLSIWDLAVDIFEHSVLHDHGEVVQSRVQQSLTQLVLRERHGNLVPRPLFRSFRLFLRTFSSSSYDSLFTRPITKSTRSFYQVEAQKGLVELDSSAYLKRVSKRLQEEDERCESLLGVELKDELARMIEEEMIQTLVETIAEKDTAAMCKEDRRDDLGLLYTLLGRIDRVAALRKAFLDHLKAAGLALVQDATQDASMVDNLIAFRHNALALVQACFKGDGEFASAINQAFEFFINKRENKPAEMMAKYLDAKLRSGGSRGLDDAALEAVLNNVLYLFRFTQGKDIFEAFYKRDLAKRLLLNKSASFDAERSMLLKLKDECGAGFTQKLEVMFKDMELSADVMRAYSATSSAPSSKKDPSSFDLSVSVLSQGNWPTYPPFPIALPPALSTALESFKAFYVSKHSGRTLTWAHGLDTCSLRAVFPSKGKGGGKKELLVSLAQAVVLLLFNSTAPAGEGEEEGKLSLEEIAEATKLEKKELTRTLQSLACGKVRVLVKHPKGKDVNAGDHFSFNRDFKDDHVRIKINQIQQKETVEENKSTTERVFTDRSSHLQLAIVRIMKARKTLKHQELVMEVVSQIGQRFKVEPAEIKKSISSLIDREYMRRSEEDQKVYHYVA